jgi:hypothetical protein
VTLAVGRFQLIPIPLLLFLLQASVLWWRHHRLVDLLVVEGDHLRFRVGGRESEIRGDLIIGVSGSFSVPELLTISFRPSSDPSSPESLQFMPSGRSFPFGQHRAEILLNTLRSGGAAGSGR